MRAKEFIVEYRRDITAQALGPKLVAAAAKDFSYTDRDHIRQSQLSPEGHQAAVDSILAQIESKDPTANKMYSQWLARMYAVGNVRLEDLDRGGALEAYDIGKKRKLIKPAHADINRFKDYLSFEDILLGNYDLDSLVGKDKVELSKGAANKVYEDDTIRIIVPEDKEAACYYGQGTKWCTAARKKNLFSFYHGEGPTEKLYIIMPKKPAYVGEKYQFHFSSSQFMNEKDQEIDPKEVIDRYPSIALALKKPAIATLGTDAMPPYVREKVFQYIAKKLSAAKRDALLNSNNAELIEIGKDETALQDDYEENMKLFGYESNIKEVIGASIRDFKRGMYGRTESAQMVEEIENMLENDIEELQEQLPSWY